jgi:hypothetical protein
MSLGRSAGSKRPIYPAGSILAERLPRDGSAAQRMKPGLFVRSKEPASCAELTDTSF